VLACQSTVTAVVPTLHSPFSSPPPSDTSSTLNAVAEEVLVSSSTSTFREEPDTCGTSVAFPP